MKYSSLKYLRRLNYLCFLFLFSINFPLFAKGKFNLEYPHYKIDVSYDHDKTLLVGKMQVSFYKINFPKNELLFALPGNRFLLPDPRGSRKHRIVPVFSMRSFRENNEDPKSPKGFSYGEMNIHSVSVLKNNKINEREYLEYNLEPNIDLDIGYSVENGLLRIFLKDGILKSKVYQGRSVIEIEFSTKLPEHLYEGSSNGMLLTTNWHPKLLYWNGEQDLKKSGWLKKSSFPIPSTFEVNFKAAQSGQLIVTPGNYKLMADEVKKIPFLKKPLKSFPLIFMKDNLYLMEDKEEEPLLGNSLQTEIIFPEITSFYFEDQTRKGKLFLNWAKSFLNFLQMNYGMIVPWERVIIVPVNADFEQVEVINNLVFIPFPNYKRSELMDRQALGFLTRSLGKLWFGESIWNDQEKQLWLSLGIPAFLGLRYFQYKFGSDSGIFDNIDWLNPRYKDHYFEKMVNSIPPKKNYPIISSFRKNPDSESYLKTLTYKTAMVISMLEFVVGEEVFKKGLQNFTSEYNQKIVGIKEFQKSFEKFNSPTIRNGIIDGLKEYNVFGEGSLEWFFSQWFQTNKTLDYSLQRVTVRELTNNFFEAEIVIKKIGSIKMPIEIAIETEDGKVFRKVTSGIKKKEKVFFITRSLPAKVSIDPDEKLMETSRINNHSVKFFRYRFGFDWKKDREHMILIVPGLGNNAIDGNSLGLGLRYRFDNYRINAIPGYGTKNKRLLYIFNLDRSNFGIHGLEAGFSFYEFGGVQSQGLRASFEPSQNPNEIAYKFNSSFSREKLFASRNNSKIDDKFYETGESNSFFLEYSGEFRLKNFYQINWSIWNEQPALLLPSDFAYVRGQGEIGQIFKVGYRKSVELNLIRSHTSGDSPLQKKFQLGGPNVLRGFPQKVGLSNDHMLASRLGFKFPLINSAFWGIVSTFKIQGSVFFDQGKIWSDMMPFNNVKYRKNAGIGIEWTIDTVSLFQVPLKLEIAFPMDDDEYKKPQFIFLGVLTGS